MENSKNTRPKMDRGNRAKQFMPFDALKGFREALEKMEQPEPQRRELIDEDGFVIDILDNGKNFLEKY